MRDDLPESKPWLQECGVVNLDGSKGTGTHWVAYKKNGKQVHYYDSFGDLSPPRELVAYLRRGDRTVNIDYNYNRDQNFDSVRCGHHCLEFLLNSDDDDNDDGV